MVVSRHAFQAETLRPVCLGLRWVLLVLGQRRCAIARVVAAIDEIHCHTPNIRVRLLLETTSGQGTALGAQIAPLGRMRGGGRELRRLRVYLGTCHPFAAGYDVRKAGSPHSPARDVLRHQLGLANDQLGHRFLGVRRISVFTQRPPDGPPHVRPDRLALRPVERRFRADAVWWAIQSHAKLSICQ